MLQAPKGAILLDEPSCSAQTTITKGKGKEDAVMEDDGDSHGRFRFCLWHPLHGERIFATEVGAAV